MNHDEINLVGSYHRPFWFPFASVYVPVTPCVIDGSLSFLEMVWKLLRDLNKTIEATNQNHTDILTIVNEINALYDLYENKLSFLEVNFTNSGNGITMDKTFTEIKDAYDEGIVIGRYTVDHKDRFFIAASHYVPPTGTVTPETFYMYALTDTFKLGVFTIREDRITYREDSVITNEGGQITGTLQLPNRDPVPPTEAVPKFYVNAQDAATLQSAKDYADAQDTIELQAAKDYADAQDAITLQAAKDYAAAQDAITLQAAKDYAVAQDLITLQAAKTYADQNFVHTDGDSGNTYASRNQTETTFTDIPMAPNTITISGLLAKLARWYQEIKDKITRARISYTGGVYKCDKTFAEIYQLFSEGQEVQIVYDDPMLTLETSIMRTEHYGPSSITFSGDGHTCTINSADVITFS
jgi:hypothetical protein